MSKTAGSVILPIASSVAVTPNDSVDLSEGVCRSIYVGSSGALAVQYENGQTDTLVNFAAGIWHPMRVIRVLATGTTATDIHVGY